ncbi:MAG TPA: SGNH/GDSL hydrolase family protein [Terriglobales bacterium]
MLKLRLLSRSTFAVLLIALSITLGAEDKKLSGHWVSAWSTAVHTPLPFPGLPPAPVFENQTIRMIVRPSIGGDRLRICLSNAFGATALAVGRAHLALTKQDATIIPESDRALTFGGRPSVNIPPGAPMLSDPVDLKVSAFSEISVSIYLPEKTPTSSVHFWGQHTTYISEQGDLTSKPDIPNATTKSSWYWLSDLEVWTSDEVAATVAFGDSITDGVGAKQGDYSDWPDMLAKRLAAQEGQPALAVANEGIGGNRVLYDGAGVSALARFDRDVLAQPGVVNMIVLEAINDIGWPHMKPRMPNGDTPREMPFVHQLASAQDLITGYQQLIDRAHQHGIRVFGGTLTPYEGADYYSDDGEATRQEVNRWIRASAGFDGVVDFDAAVRDPSHPTKFLAQYDSGDHLHPSAAGFKAMADAVDLSLLRGAGKPQMKK